MKLLIVIFSTYFFTTIYSLKLHEYLTNEELRSLFNCKCDTVPDVEYEVVHLLHKDKTNERHIGISSRIVQIKAFNQDYTLYLENNDHVLFGNKTPVFTAIQHPYGIGPDLDSNIAYTRRRNPFEDIVSYHDRENRAAVTVHRDANNRVHVDGVIGDDIVIRSLPSRVHEDVLRKHPDFYNFTHSTFPDLFSNTQRNNNFSENHNQQIPHLAIKRNNQMDSQSEDFFQNQFDYTNEDLNPIQTNNQPINWDPDTLSLMNAQNSRMQGTFSPGIRSPVSSITATSDTVYPRLFIVVDYETSKIHEKKYTIIAKYIAAFFNAVDLRFRGMNYPKVRLNIAGIIVANEANGAPYMERNLDGSGAILASETIQDIAKHFQTHNKISRNSYDIVVGITSRILKHPRPNGQLGSINGIAGGSGMCYPYLSVALIGDKGGFNGIITAAHELGHNMGAPHDWENSPVSGGPCPDGYLMSYNRLDANGMHWSQCSIRAMMTYLQSTMTTCLRNKPDVGTPYPKVLPGKILTRDEQCERQLGMTSCKEKEDNCAVLWCQSKENNPYSRSSYRPPAEGTSCSGGGICLDGECVIQPLESG